MLSENAVYLRAWNESYPISWTYVACEYGANDVAEVIMCLSGADIIICLTFLLMQ